MLIPVNGFFCVPCAFCRSMIKVVLSLVQDNPWTYLQCTETLHGNEPEAVWWLHSAVQSREAKVRSEVNENKQIDVLSQHNNSILYIGLTTFLAIVHCICSICFPSFYKHILQSIQFLYDSLWLINCKLFCFHLLREKYKFKEREEIWHKIEQLAKQNPQVKSAWLAVSFEYGNNRRNLISKAIKKNRWNLVCACTLILLMTYAFNKALKLYSRYSIRSGIVLKYFLANQQC